MSRLLPLVVLFLGCAAPPPPAASAGAAGAPCDDAPPLAQATTAAEVRCALGAGADPDAQTADNGRTVLHDAAANGLDGVVAALLDGGADPAAATDRGMTPLHVASTPAAVQALVAAGADLEAAAEYGHTPLHWAITRGDAGALRALVAAGAALDATDEDGAPLMVHAVTYAGADAATLALLVELGADPAAAHDGRTALHAAAGNDDPETVRALLGLGFDPDAPTLDAYAQRPLHLAFLFGVEASAVPVLLAAGADPRATDGDGRTPLSVAEAAEGGDYWEADEALAALRAALAE